MSYSLKEIKTDIADLSAKDFYLKHILRSHCWYFETILEIESDDIVNFTGDFKKIISDDLKINFNNIAMVGSGKIGYSLTPISPKQNKLFKEFNDDNHGDSHRKKSDVDIAIISNQLFQMFWDLLRKSYKSKYGALYQHIPTAIYRGYIDEYNLLEIEGCRKTWKDISVNSKKSLHNNLYIKHDIAYRLYRRWDDFEDYHISSLKKIMRGGSCNANTIS